MKNTKNQSMAASPWAVSVGVSVGTREQHGVAPIASLQGTGLPFGGYPTAHSTQLAAVRKDDARVPDPRRHRR